MTILHCKTHGDYVERCYDCLISKEHRAYRIIMAAVIAVAFVLVVLAFIGGFYLYHWTYTAPV